MAAVAVLLLAGPARAAFPGANGKLAYNGAHDPGANNQEIWSANPDGSGEVDLTNNPSDADLNPAWSPDGTKLAWTRRIDQFTARIWVMNAEGTGQHVLSAATPYEQQPSWSPDGTKLTYVSLHDTPTPDLDLKIYTMNADGTNQQRVTSGTTGAETDPRWSPDGQWIAFNNASKIWKVHPDGTGLTLVTAGNRGFAGGLDWSPDGSKIAFQTYDDTLPPNAFTFDVFVMNVDGTGQVQLGAGSSPAWSPDGTKIAFVGETLRLNVMNADGSGSSQITSTQNFNPDWQPIVPGVNAYPRPKGATPTRVSLVPTFQQCAFPNRTHGSPLAFGSCTPPNSASVNLTVGTSDANGEAANEIGSVRLSTITGNPSTPADEADVELDTSVTDVRLKSLADYAGELRAVIPIRLTDRASTPAPGAATVSDFDYGVTVPCMPTGDPAAGSTCSLATTADAQAPGAVPEGGRSVWQLGRVQVYDGGVDGDADTPDDNTLFMRQGVFVP